ncbi:MAG: transcription antitermination factor NusB [Cytophagales bacterium]|nr:transcription antitermination factor NusB [Cytophagales bacterium]
MSEVATKTALVKTRSTSPRARAREFALQALYQLLVGKNDISAIDAFTRDLTGFHKCNVAHYDALVYGCAREASHLDTHIEAYLDRAWHEIAPIEHAVMWIGAYEYLHCPDVPWRVVLNECIELTKSFGGTDGHKYVNGVLHQLAGKLRTKEVQDIPVKPETSHRKAATLS